MTKIIVYHGGYGCHTGCCGHIIERDGEKTFMWEHVWDDDPLEFAKRLVVQELGEEHVKDLDWDNCLIMEKDGCDFG